MRDVPVEATGASSAVTQGRPAVLGKRWMVSSSHYLASQAGARMFERGGNAVDAGVAAGIALSVVHSDQVQFSGVAPMVIYLAERDEVVTIAGLGGWPRATRADDLIAARGIPLGVQRTVVPAAPDAWILALERYGTMRFGDVASAAEMASGSQPRPGASPASTPALAITAATGVDGVLNMEELTERLMSPAALPSPLVITERDVRDLVAGLHTLSSSHAGQMMFGDSTVTVDASTPYLLVDLSGHDDDTLRVLMVAVTGWITGLWGSDRLRPKVVVMDEFWRLLTDRATAEWAKYAFKMSREHGASYIAVLQHLGDLRSVDEDTRVAQRLPEEAAHPPSDHQHHHLRAEAAYRSERAQPVPGRPQPADHRGSSFTCGYWVDRPLKVMGRCVRQGGASVPGTDGLPTLRQSIEARPLGSSSSQRGLG